MLTPRSSSGRRLKHSEYYLKGNNHGRLVLQVCLRARPSAANRQALLRLCWSRGIGIMVRPYVCLPVCHTKCQGLAIASSMMGNEFNTSSCMILPWPSDEWMVSSGYVWATASHERNLSLISSCYENTYPNTSAIFLSCLHSMS